MMNAIQIFDYKSNKVRTVEQDGRVWFVAKDVCDILGLTNPTEALRGLDDDEKMTLRNSEGHSGQRGGAQFINVISESGVYFLTFHSNKPEAKNFARWVRKEVLPSIMRTGKYSVEQGDEVLALAQRIVAQHEENQALKEKIEDDKEKVEFADAVSHSDNSYSWQDMANSMAQNGADIGQNRAVKWGLENRYLCRRSGHSYLQPTLKAIKQGLLEVDLRTRTVRITPKGLFRLARDMDSDRTEWLFDPEEFVY